MMPKKKNIEKKNTVKDKPPNNLKNKTNTKYVYSIYDYSRSPELARGQIFFGYIRNNDFNWNI